MTKRPHRSPILLPHPILRLPPLMLQLLPWLVLLLVLVRLPLPLLPPLHLSLLLLWFSLLILFLTLFLSLLFRTTLRTLRPLRTHRLFLLPPWLSLNLSLVLWRLLQTLRLLGLLQTPLPLLRVLEVTRTSKLVLQTFPQRRIRPRRPQRRPLVGRRVRKNLQFPRGKSLRL